MSGALLLSLVGGIAVTAWVLLTGDPSLRSSKPAITLVLLLATGLSVTAVPVLARLLADVGLLDSEVGKLAMVTAVATDAGAWVLVALAVGLTGHRDHRGLSAARLAAAADRAGRPVPGPVPPLDHRADRGDGSGRCGVDQTHRFDRGVRCARRRLRPVAKPQWEKVVGTVSRLGRQLVPVSFVATGITVLTSGMRSPRGVTVLTVFATAGKVAGSYLGARAAGKAPELSLRLGVLLNTRGLTELVVLQAGYSAEILTAPLFAGVRPDRPVPRTRRADAPTADYPVLR